jgi:hypothetical protein
MVRLVKAANGNGSVAGELSPVEITTTGYNSKQLDTNVGKGRRNAFPKKQLLVILESSCVKDEM